MSEPKTPVLAVEHLVKEYRTGMRRRRVRAVNDVSLEIRRGEIFGFVGPNGAGKTTTIRSVMGLIRPTSGRTTVFGVKVPNRTARSRIGFLPEAPYFHDYLTAREMLDLAGRLHGLDRPTRRRRASELLARVGLVAAADRPMRKYSKGMLQRVGLAQALVNDPELVILDEPMSGLDPLGRKEVRDLIVELREAGKTVFFSTHILHDVESICDRVAIISGGKVQETGSLDELVDATSKGTDVALRAPVSVDVGALVPEGARILRKAEEVMVTLPAAADLEAFLQAACQKCKVVSVTPRRESLEDLYVRRAGRSGERP